MKIILVLLMGAAMVVVGGCGSDDGLLSNTSTGSVELVTPNTEMLRAEGETIVSGSVVDGDAAPLEGVTVFVQSCEGDSSAVEGEHEFLAMTDADGLFSIVGVPAGTHTLIARLMTYERYMEEFEIADAEVVEFDIVLLPKEGPATRHRHMWEGEEGPHGGN